MIDESKNKLVEKILHNALPQKIDEKSVKEIESAIAGYMNDIEYSVDGKLLVIGGNSGDVQVINAGTNRLNRTLTDHTHWVLCIAFSSDGQKLATCSFDHSIVVYNLPDFSIFNRLLTNASIFGICFSNCSNYVYSCDNEGTLKKWDINNCMVVLEKIIHSNSVWRIKLSKDSRHLLTCSDDKTVKLVDPCHFSVIRSFDHDGSVRAIEFHPTKRIIAAGDELNKVKLWNIDDGSLLHTFDMGGQVFSLHFLGSNLLLIMSGDGYITLFNIDHFSDIQKVYCGCSSCFFSFAISPDRTQLACGQCEGNVIKMYSVAHSYDPFRQSELIELSKTDGNVLSNLLGMNVDLQIIRQLVSAGICMNEEDYNMTIETCWDLVDLNENNGGNMQTFAVEHCENSDDDIDDD
eukprot:TRINITY_DN3068_c10_g1_i1.p1 TRINITY_DN3068_c10_g1~~TRINITY_DN3068_c10_g1_i1.p1  ORF type:complete len:405 (-),score=96.33 TRINITY_DN3068_c10_g1_i1:943-2157(-)